MSCGDGGFPDEYDGAGNCGWQYGVDVKVVVFKNTRLGMVRELQTKGLTTTDRWRYSLTVHLIL
ncbi:thiamine pyrophosphate-dependent enzyme [Ruminococcus albus]|uniref:thiamine pyrophosphate-dependent enzyme n=1 Tax=Ruminococcus albus TaxID=1264 RepID=UPI0024184ADC|nr:thiamine pyrophosphate-dependent enzyme [Ruminococcus albus]